MTEDCHGPWPFEATNPWESCPDCGGRLSDPIRKTECISGNPLPGCQNEATQYMTIQTPGVTLVRQPFCTSCGDAFRLGLNWANPKVVWELTWISEDPVPA